MVFCHNSLILINLEKVNLPGTPELLHQWPKHVLHYPYKFIKNHSPKVANRSSKNLTRYGLCNRLSYIYLPAF